MAKSKIKHQAVLPDGQIAKRVSESRRYSHVIAGRASYENALARAVSPDAIKAIKGDWRHYANCASVQPGEHYPDPRYRFAVRDADHERGKALQAEFGNVEAYVAAELEKRRAEIEAKKAAGDFDKWGALGWSANLALAQKRASGEFGGAWFAEVKIIPAEVEA